MAFKDLSQLPTGDPDRGNPPNPQPYYAQKLAEAWAAKLDDGSHPMSHPDARMRHSDAGKCARQLGYKLAGFAEDRPMDLAGRWVTGLGTLVHERWQDAMVDAFPGVEIEKKVFIEECNSAGHIDAFLQRPIHVPEDRIPVQTSKVALELKTINGFGFKMAVGARGAAEGPRGTAIMQTAMNGLASDADELVIINLAMENMSTREVEKLYDDPAPWQKFAAEWTFTREQYEDLAKREVTRFSKVQELVDGGELPPRAVPLEMPIGARITDPSKGNWQLHVNGDIVQTGSYWGCGYCPFQDTCITDAAVGF